jgi:hypothetical protein
MLPQNKDDKEIIIRQFRRYTRWISGTKTLGQGTLILTNQRLIFLHRIKSSPEVTAAIEALSKAPMAEVLDHALTLDRENFQIPLSSVVSAGTGIFYQFPFPHFCLNVVYFRSAKKKLTTYAVSFQFLRPGVDMILHPQFAMDRAWGIAIKSAVASFSETEENQE